jgi:glutamine amidotransferase
MTQLQVIGGDDIIRARISADKPVFGICVGHQVLCTNGVEHGVSATGIGVFDTTVALLPTRRVPHMGWNEVVPGDHSRFFPATRRYYFVHSYAVLGAQGLPKDAVVMTTEHDQVSFVSALEYASVLSTQFHPEKSGRSGLALISRWIEAL